MSADTEVCCVMLGCDSTFESIDECKECQFAVSPISSGFPFMIFVCKKCQKERPADCMALSCLCRVVEQRIYLYHCNQAINAIKPGSIPKPLLSGLSSPVIDKVTDSNGVPLKKR